VSECVGEGGNKGGGDKGEGKGVFVRASWMMKGGV